jgi:hypothetical protein
VSCTAEFFPGLAKHATSCDKRWLLWFLCDYLERYNDDLVVVAMLKTIHIACDDANVFSVAEVDKPFSSRSAKSNSTPDRLEPEDVLARDGRLLLWRVVETLSNFILTV